MKEDTNKEDTAEKPYRGEFSELQGDPADDR